MESLKIIRRYSFGPKVYRSPFCAVIEKTKKRAKSTAIKFWTKVHRSVFFSLGNGGFVECLVFVVFWHSVLKSIMQVLPDAKIYNTYIKLKYQCATEQ